MACCEDREEFPLYILSQTDVKLELYEEETGDAVTDATVTAQFYHLAGTTLGDAVDMPFQAVATYLGVFPATAITDGALYYAIITAVRDGETCKTIRRWYRAMYDEAT